jgi:predicted PurR-regulated permease PerM
MRDHHVLHAARGVAHIWSAVIIAGFAIVLTGAISYHIANAENQQTEQTYRQNSTKQIINKIESLERRLDVMESDIEGMFRASAGTGSNATPETVFPPLN